MPQPGVLRSFDGTPRHFARGLSDNIVANTLVNKPLPAIRTSVPRGKHSSNRIGQKRFSMEASGRSHTHVSRVPRHLKRTCKKVCVVLHARSLLPMILFGGVYHHHLFVGGLPASLALQTAIEMARAAFASPLCIGTHSFLHPSSLHPRDHC